MNARDFLVSELKLLAKQLDSVRLRYKYDAATNTHVVEVTPQRLYDSDGYALLEVKAWSRFSKRFPNEGLAFITDDNLVSFDEVEGYAEYTICGAGYASGESKAQRPYTARRKAKTQEVEYA